MGGASDFGWLGVIAAGHRFGTQLDGTGTELFVFSTFGTDDFLNKDFGVSAADSIASGLAQTDLDAGYRSTGLTAVHRRYLTRHIHVIAQAGIEFYGNEIQKSPIAREDYETEIGLALVYHF
jgi:outer membrane scaffolding protein for murein synthesis (MipA/OmpV family)